MYEFLSVVDANHDDPTIFPVLSGPGDALPFAWEEADGDTQPSGFITKNISISQYTGRGWTQLRRFSDLQFTVAITGGRVVVYCEKFTKGGGWVGFGVGGLAFAAVANVVSHARAAARRRGKVLVGQIRYPTLMQVSAPPDKRGRLRSLRLVVDASTADEPRPLALELGLKQRQNPAAYANAIAALTARSRLRRGPAIASDDLAAWESLARDPAPHASGTTWSLPSWVRVGHPDSVPGAVLTAPSIGEAAPPPAIAVEQAEATVRRSALALPGGDVGPESPPIASQSAAAGTVCAGCGNSLLAGAKACGRCGMPVAAVATEATTDAAPATDAAEQYYAAQYPPPPEGWRPVTPPAIWLVAIGLLALAGFVFYPVVKVAQPVISHVFDGDPYTRAFVNLLLFAVAGLAACGTVLVVLSVGLIKGSRVAQVFACVLAAVVSVAVLVQHQNEAGYGNQLFSAGVVAAVVVISVLVVLLVALPTTSREFFSYDRRPVGVVVAASANAFLGSVALLDGVLIMLCGALGEKVVWIGLGLAVVGALFLATNRPLRAGNPTARSMTVLLYVGLIILVFVNAATVNSGNASPATLIPILLAAASLVGLTLPAASQAHFRVRPGLPPIAPATIIGAIAIAIAVIATAGYGFHSASHPYDTSAYSPDYSVPTEVPTEVPTDTATYLPTYAPSSSAPPSLDGDTARNTADQAFSAMENGGTVNLCNSELPSMDVASYTIEDVTPETSGSFSVSAEVYLDDGSAVIVTVLIGMDYDDDPCVDADSMQSTPESNADYVPADVPSVPSASDDVPTDAQLPDAPQNGTTLPYDDSATPTTADEIVEYQPDDLDGDQTDAVASIVEFMTYVNQQDFPSAWDVSTLSLSGSSPTAGFENDYTTSRFYQVAFGEPVQVTHNLMVVPSRWVSRQDAAVQHANIPDCTYWPQYLFVVARVGGQWLVDTAGRYGARPELTQYKRRSDDGSRKLNPIAQRVTC